MISIMIENYTLADPREITEYCHLYTLPKYYYM